MAEQKEIPVMPWLQAKADQLLARMRQEIGKSGLTPAVAFADIGIVMTPLTEPPEKSTREEIDRWEFTCDNCGAYCPPPFVRFNCGQLSQTLDGVRVLIMWGACETCTGAGA